MRNTAALNLPVSTGKLIGKQKYLHALNVSFQKEQNARRESKKQYSVSLNPVATVTPLLLRHEMYSRPFTYKEALILLKSAKINFEEINKTYIPTWLCCYDTETGRRKFDGLQAVVAKIPVDVVCVETKKIIETRFIPAHLYFTWGQRGWLLAQVFIEKS